MFSHPVGSIIGNASYKNYLVIYQNVTLSAGALVVNQDIPDNNIVFGQSKNLILKPEKSRIIQYTYNKIQD